MKSSNLEFKTSFLAVDLSKNGYETFTTLALKIDFWRGLVENFSEYLIVGRYSNLICVKVPARSASIERYRSPTTFTKSEILFLTNDLGLGRWTTNNSLQI
ncbi:hypothetical protein DP113_00510 [Brasilonema octagenarum UFV-E1]|uniref:Uncharacterized protein n=2 Tax=Brasilonema TaxID=383614 RepID=A0A856MA07_9CYAN|nr:hypothetical protein [Brasilonema octagenarum UFV-OR1]QDL06591.1 hypothetical protein DP114_00510 [Brasilonema sennae CENA114]QDL12961.1 hypothetical protein DP113_00510 [Brasilonema octagenarum UFV-E1]